ncbi:MAG: hypothetical protein ACKODR_07800 [Acidimicrobiaceae bacterium]
MMNRDIEVVLHRAHQHIGAFLICGIDARRILAITNTYPEITRKRQQCASTSREVVRVELTNGNVISGRATSLDANGRLIIETGDEKRSIDTGDVVHLRDANHE